MHSSWLEPREYVLGVSQRKLVKAIKRHCHRHHVAQRLNHPRDVDCGLSEHRGSFVAELIGSAVVQRLSHRIHLRSRIPHTPFPTHGYSLPANQPGSSPCSARNWRMLVISPVGFSSSSNAGMGASSSASVSSLGYPSSGSSPTRSK